MTVTPVLADVCEITMGQAPSGESYNTDGEGLPLIAGAGDFGEVHPFAKKYTTEATKICETGDIVLGIRATIGEKVIADGRYCLGRGVAGLRPRNGLDGRFLWHWLTDVNPVLVSKAKGATFLQVNRNDIGELPISLPPLPEQRRIATILDRVDGLRAKRREALAQLGRLAQSIFVQMFGDPVTNPKGWPVRQLAELGENQDAKRIPVKSSERDGRQGDYPYYGASGIIDWVDDFIFEGERLLIAEDGANLVSRSTPVAFMACGRYWVNNHAHVIAPNGTASLRYLEFFLEYVDLAPYISGSAQPKLNRKNLDRIPVMLPPLPLQEEFSSRVDSIRVARERQKESLALVDGLFSSVQQQAFRGKL